MKRFIPILPALLLLTACGSVPAVPPAGGRPRRGRVRFCIPTKNRWDRGLAQVSKWVRLKFAAMNLKKLAKWKWRGLVSSLSLPRFFTCYICSDLKWVYAFA